MLIANFWGLPGIFKPEEVSVGQTLTTFIPDRLTGVLQTQDHVKSTDFLPFHSSTFISQELRGHLQAR